MTNDSLNLKVGTKNVKQYTLDTWGFFFSSNSQRDLFLFNSSVLINTEYAIYRANKFKKSII